MYPFLRVEVELGNLAVVEKRRQSHAVICEIWLFTQHRNVIFAFRSIVFQNLFSNENVLVLHVRWFSHGRAYMKDMPTIPRPTTTSFFLGGTSTSMVTRKKNNTRR